MHVCLCVFLCEAQGQWHACTCNSESPSVKHRKHHRRRLTHQIAAAHPEDVGKRQQSNERTECHRTGTECGIVRVWNFNVIVYLIVIAPAGATVCVFGACVCIYMYTTNDHSLVSYTCHTRRCAFIQEMHKNYTRSLCHACLVCHCFALYCLICCSAFVGSVEHVVSDSRWLSLYINVPVHFLRCGIVLGVEPYCEVFVQAGYIHCVN